MNDLSPVFLGIIAVATLVMALIQVGAVIAMLRLAREAQGMLASVQRDVKPLLAQAGQMAEDAKPLIARANHMAEEASRTLTLATVQAQKVDRLVTDLAHRVDETSVIVQQAIITPAREGIAIVAAIKGFVGALRSADFRGRARRSEEEDPLFIG